MPRNTALLTAFALALSGVLAHADPPTDLQKDTFSYDVTAPAKATRGGANLVGEANTRIRTIACVSKIPTGQKDAQGHEIYRYRTIPAKNVETAGDEVAIANWGKAPFAERKVGAAFLKAQHFGERFSACTTVEAGDDLWNQLEARWVAKVIAARPQDKALIDAYGKASTTQK